LFQPWPPARDTVVAIGQNTVRHNNHSLPKETDHYAGIHNIQDPTSELLQISTNFREVHTKITDIMDHQHRNPKSAETASVRIENLNPSKNMVQHHLHIGRT
jgi:hypothetical protein